MSSSNLKNRTAISNAIDTKLWNKLKEYSIKSHVPLSKLLDMAIEEFLKSTK